MEVEKRTFRTQYVQIKAFEASWPGARVAHRIQPLHGSMNAHTKNNRQDQCVHAQSYASMLHNLMGAIQDYLLLNGNNKERGTLNSLELVDSTAEVREDNRICIWHEDVQTQR